MADNETLYSAFGGLKNDTDPKQTPPQYFVKATNWNFPDNGLPGMDKILFPLLINTIGSHQIDGLYEYRYLSTGNVLQTEQIAFTDGSIYKTVLGTEVLLKSGLTAGRASFAAYNDKLFIANGLNYVNIYYGALGIVSEMGAPAAVLTTTAGNVNVGTHYYALTYVTPRGEEVVGSISNVVTVASAAKQIILHLPIGYAGTTTRKVYRTEAGGTTLKLLHDMGDNTTFTYTDNIADASLTTAIPATNNELPKPYFLTVAGQSLYGAKVSKYPTQVFRSDTNLEVWDLASFIDVANYGNDNTPIEGMGIDFNQVIIGTGKQIYFVEPEDTTPTITTVKATRSNVGILNGYSVVNVPSFGDFPGGLMFLSTLNDVRIINGQQALPVSTTFGNITTQNWAQDIRASLNADLSSYTNICAEFYNYRYHLAIDNTKNVFDIRSKGWTQHKIISLNHESKPRCFATMGTPLKLYNGQPDGAIEKEYNGTQYKGEEVFAILQSPFMEVSRLFKWFKKLLFWFKTSLTSTTTITTVLDSNENYPITANINLYGGIFNPIYFNSTYFLTTGSGSSDYRVVNITNPCRWAQFTLTCTQGNISLMSWGAVGEPLMNKEMKL